jgi:hypothetical protein
MIIAFIVFILMVKPEDIKLIMQKASFVFGYLSEFKKEFISHLNIDITNLTDDVNTGQPQCFDERGYDPQNEIEFYLQKIINIQGYYEGDYTLQQVKVQYNTLMRLRIEEEINKQ